MFIQLFSFKQSDFHTERIFFSNFTKRERGTDCLTVLGYVFPCGDVLLSLHLLYVQIDSRFAF